MKLVFISDTHNQAHNVSIPHGDVLIHCGDFTGAGKLPKIAAFLAWMEKKPHKHKVFIAGNHDLATQDNPQMFKALLEGFPTLTYLEESEIEIEGFFFYGAPWTPRYYDWAWMLDRGSIALQNAWKKIPDYTDILITHGPAYGTGDLNTQGKHTGCELLRDRIEDVKPMIHAFGHIHESYGIHVRQSETLSINASTCTSGYKPKNKPIVVNI